MRCSLNPLGAEEELVEPLRVDEVAVAGGDPGRLPRLQWQGVIVLLGWFV